MLVEQNTAVTQLSPGGPRETHHHSSSSELSPQSCSTSSSLASNQSPLHNASSTDTPTKANNNSSPNSKDQDFSALQRLQFAFDKNSLLSSFFNQAKNQTEDNLTEHQRRMFMAPNQNMVIAHNAHRSSPENYSNSNELMMSPSYNEREHQQKLLSPVVGDQDHENSNEGDDKSVNVFQCPLCSIQCSSRHDFNEHLVSVIIIFFPF